MFLSLHFCLGYMEYHDGSASGDLSRILSQFTWPAAPQELITITFYNPSICHHHSLHQHQHYLQQQNRFYHQHRSHLMKW